METLQWLLAEIVKYLADLFISLLTYGISFALLGLVIGIVGVVIAGRSGIFKRSNSLWSLIAGLNYVYVPLILAIFGGFFGTVYGTHTCADRFIDDTAKPLTQYGQTYLTQAMAIVPEIPWERHHDKSLDEILSVEMSQRLGTEQGSTAHQFFTVINQSVIKHALKEAGVPSTLSDPMAVLRDYKTRRLPSNAFISLPRTIHQHCDAYFSLKYAFVFWIFLPFLLLPFAEYMLYRFLGRKTMVPQSAPFAQAPSFGATSPLNTSFEMVAAPLAEVKEVPKVMVNSTVEPLVPEIKAVPEEIQIAVEPLVPELEEMPEVMAFKAVETPALEVQVVSADMKVAEEPLVPERKEVPEVVPFKAVEAPTPEVKEAPEAIKTEVAPPVVVAKTYQQNPIISNVQTSNNMKQIPSSTAVTYILGGALLQLYAGIDDGWLSLIIAIFGFAIFYQGLDKLKVGLDSTGQSAVGMLKSGALVGGVAAFVDFIPFLGILASLGYVAAFVIELVAYLKLKDSISLGATGKSGASFLLIAMILAIVQSLLSFIPFIGGYIAAPIGLAALILVFFGWVRIQEGMHGVVNAQEG